MGAGDSGDALHGYGRGQFTSFAVDPESDPCKSTSRPSGLPGLLSSPFIVLGMTMLTSGVDRRFSLRHVELGSSEQRYRQLVESARVILWRRQLRPEFNYVNAEAVTLLGYPVGRLANPTGILDRSHASG